MNIIASFDASGTSAPAGFRSAVAAACNFFDSAFTNDVTVSITFSWGQLGAGALAQTSTFGQDVAYGTVVRALAAHDAATPGLSSVVLPTSDPFTAPSQYVPAGDLFVPNAQVKALGLGTTSGTDASITLNSDETYDFGDPQVPVGAGQFGAVGTLEHEISEALGRQLGGDGSFVPTAEALLRYTSRGVIDTSSSYANAYLSLDGGATNAGPGHVGEASADLADWSSDVSGDAFGYGDAGTAETVSAADLKLMTALGWSQAAPVAAPTISGTHGTATAQDAAVAPFSGVTVADANGGAADAVTIALSGAGGTLSGQGLTQNPDGTYGLAAASAATITAELDALRFTPSAGAPGTSSTTRFAITAASSAGTSVTDTATTVTDAERAVPPAISGTHGTATLQDAAVAPFSGVTVADANGGGADAVTIALSGAGGTLSGQGLTQNPDGTYGLAAASAATVTAELDALRFTPSAGAPGTSSTTRFAITAASSAGTSVTDTATTVTDAERAVPPAISGTHGTATAQDAAVAPFSGVTVADANGGAADIVTIALSGAGGTLSGQGLTQNPDGTYGLAAASAATITAELDALRFTPSAGAPGTSSTTRFAITAASSAGTSVTDTATTVTDAERAVPPAISGTHGTATAQDAAVAPFSGVTVADANGGAADIVTIALSGAGGTLSGQGLTQNPDGTYGLAAASAATVTAELNALRFTPSAGAPGTSSTTRFAITAASSAGTSVTDTATTVTDAERAVPPAISGTHGTATAQDAAVAPFSGVTVADANGGAADAVTIALSGAGGTLSGQGLTQNPDGTYGLAAASTATVTAELNALRFTPSAGAPGTSSTTRFAITAASSAGTSVTDTATTVTDSDRATPIVAFDRTTAGFKDGRTPILTGTISDPSGTAGIEIYAGDPAAGAQDLGAATLNGDGTWTFVSNLGTGDFSGITAVATEADGQAASAVAPYELLTGVTGQPFRAVEYDGTPDGSYGYTEFGRDGTPLVSAVDTGDGTHAIFASADRQVLTAIANDTLTGGGLGERFVFNPHFGQDEITDFVVGGAGHDTIDLSNTAFSTMAQVLRHTSMTAGGAEIHLTPQDSIMVDGVSKAQLKAHPNAIALA